MTSFQKWNVFTPTRLRAVCSMLKRTSAMKRSCWSILVMYLSIRLKANSYADGTLLAKYKRLLRVSFLALRAQRSMCRVCVSTSYHSTLNGVDPCRTLDKLTQRGAKQAHTTHPNSSYEMARDWTRAHRTLQFVKPSNLAFVLSL